jgi:NADH dehydrogenase
LHTGRVTRILARDRQVLFADGLAMPYDRLVITLGGTTNFAGVPGAAEHGWPLRSYDEALRLRDHIRACFQRAAQTDDPRARQTLLTFVIVGGGFTGVQLAGELAAWARTLCHNTGIPCNAVRVALLERNTLLLQQFGQWATQEAERVLDARGVSVHLNTAVERVDPHAVHLAENRVIYTATTVWAGGVRAPALLAESGLTTDAIGRLMVDRYLRASEPEAAPIFAAGDCAHIPDYYGGSIPATASYAMRQGEHLASALWDDIRGIAPSTYLPLRLGELVSLGPGEAVGNPLGVTASGMPVALLKEGVDKWYLTTLW